MSPKSLSVLAFLVLVAVLVYLFYRGQLFDGPLTTAVQIAAGCSPADIAATDGVSVLTIRTQLKAAFDKLDVRRQPELSALVNSVSSVCACHTQFE